MSILSPDGWRATLLLAIRWRATGRRLTRCRRTRRWLAERHPVHSGHTVAQRDVPHQAIAQRARHALGHEHHWQDGLHARIAPSLSDQRVDARGDQMDIDTGLAVVLFCAAIPILSSEAAPTKTPGSRCRPWRPGRPAARSRPSRDRADPNQPWWHHAAAAATAAWARQRRPARIRCAAGHSPRHPPAQRSSITSSTLTSSFALSRSLRTSLLSATRTWPMSPWLAAPASKWICRSVSSASKRVSKPSQASIITRSSASRAGDAVRDLSRAGIAGAPGGVVVPGRAGAGDAAFVSLLAACISAVIARAAPSFVPPGACQVPRR